MFDIIVKWRFGSVRVVKREGKAGGVGKASVTPCERNREGKDETLTGKERERDRKLDKREKERERLEGNKKKPLTFSTRKIGKEGVVVVVVVVCVREKSLDWLVFRSGF